MDERTAIGIIRIAGVILTAVTATASLFLLLVAWNLGAAHSPPWLQIALISWVCPLSMIALTLAAEPLGRLVAASIDDDEDVDA